MIWTSALKGDREINPMSVDNAKDMDQFDWDTQGGLRKVFYEQNRAMKGLPTT